jgi:preprotein translocase subunit Sec63
VDETLEWVVSIDSWQQVAVLALILAYLVYRSHRGARKVKKVEAEVSSANAGVAAVNEGVTQVLHQVENNSGSSLKDAVDRIETGQAELVDLLGNHITESKQDSERLAALEHKYLNPDDPGL